jgi:hypothetical protein
MLLQMMMSIGAAKFLRQTCYGDLVELCMAFYRRRSMFKPVWWHVLGRFDVVEWIGHIRNFGILKR